MHRTLENYNVCKTKSPDDPGGGLINSYPEPSKKCRTKVKVIVIAMSKPLCRDDAECDKRNDHHQKGDDGILCRASF